MGLLSELTRTRLAGGLLVTGSATFWVCWALMPMPGTTDPAFILDAVAAARPQVLASCAVQLLSAAAWTVALVLAPGPPGRRGQLAWWGGASLLAVGMTASAADAIYHLAAYELTDPAVPVDVALPVMSRLQGVDLALLLPGVGAFAVGLGVFVLAGIQRELISRASLAWFAAAVVAGVGRALLPGSAAPRIAALAALACACAPVAWMGWSLVRSGPAGEDAEQLRPPRR